MTDKVKSELAEQQFFLQIPLDASSIEDRSPNQIVKVVVQGQSRDGQTMEQIVRFDQKGMGIAEFTFKENPGQLRVAIGPQDASAEDVMGLQTVAFNISPRQWLEPKLALSPVRIPPYYWYWWLRWCQQMVIRGRVVCPDGSPVPGAKVCAYDVDWWWWWSSKQLVGCHTTDATGTFEIKFRWCCGWWPWWWWRNRVWQLEPLLAEKIMPVLQREFKPPHLPKPTPQPDLAVFETLLADEGAVSPAAGTMLERGETAARAVIMPPTIDSSALILLRDRLLQRLPLVAELQQLKIWPWWPWQPWWDCTPDIIFQVTQACQGQETVIVNENYANTRWNISSPLNVTLVAHNACCIQDTPPPAGDCIVITKACDIQLNEIGGNFGAPPVLPAQAGLVNPGLISSVGDRPFAGPVPISGLFGDLTNVDYYEFEWSNNGGSTWNDMPLTAAGGFTRWFWGPGLPAGPVGFHPVSFPVANLSGRNVIETREHYEANNGAGTWGLQRFWTSNRDMLMNWMTANNFADGTYQLRVKSWNLDDGMLINSHILPLCDTKNDNGVVLTIDNRIVGSGSGHPITSDNPCTAVHLCTLEPYTDILAVKIIHSDNSESNVGTCGNVPINETDVLQIDFAAYDPNGHLSYYTLNATYGENQLVSLLNLVGATLTPSPIPAFAPAAVQVGPTYAHARLAGAVAPIWRGGTIRLRVPAKKAFPKTCCYQLELIAHKRTIVNCDKSLWGHTNTTEYSFAVSV